jgi:hypothetical protein
VAAVPSVEPDLTVEGFAVALTAMAFAVIGFATATSVTGSSSLGDFGDPFFYYPYPYYGYYPYGYYPYDVRYEFLRRTCLPSSAEYTDPLIGQVHSV